MNTYQKTQKLTFLSIDVEEYDLNVLKSNNWKLYRPLCVLVEDNSFSFLKMEQSVVYNFLISKNYELRFRVGNTLIFFDSNDKTL